MNNLKDYQDRYKDCNLLMPASTSTQINPFYSFTTMEVKADLSENTGDVFKLQSMKKGDVWIDIFSPAKPLLMKIATAAGIQFDPNNTYQTKISQNCYKGKAYGALRLPDGTSKTHCDEKTIDLEDEEARFRLEFMDKSIEGIKEQKAAEEAAKLFAGEWFDTENKFGKAVKGYKIADIDRQKYIDRSVLVNMTLLRKTAAEKALTGAILRVVRALLGMKSQYTKEELQKPFVIPRVVFSPNFNDPAVRSAMLNQGISSVSNMFTPNTTSPIVESSAVVLDDDFDPDEFADNAAFASDTSGGSGDEFSELNDGGLPFDTAPEPKPEQETKQSPDVCNNCGKSISANVTKYSTRLYGEPLCMDCQKER